MKEVVDKPKIKRMIRLATIAIIPKEETPTRRLMMSKIDRVIRRIFKKSKNQYNNSKNELT